MARRLKSSGTIPSKHSVYLKKTYINVFEHEFVVNNRILILDTMTERLQNLLSFSLYKIKHIQISIWLFCLHAPVLSFVLSETFDKKFYHRTGVPILKTKKKLK